MTQADLLPVNFEMHPKSVLSVVGEPFIDGKYRKIAVRCQCGNTKVLHLSNLRRTASCGCITRRLIGESFVTHGMSKTDTYSIWNNMIYRCKSPTYREFHLYGGRGIKVCDRWLKFENFLADMGVRPEGHSIDRVDTNGDYEPQNCRWATDFDQARNQRTNKLSMEKAREMRALRKSGWTCAELAKRFDVTKESVYGVLKSKQWDESAPSVEGRSSDVSLYRKTGGDR